MFNAHISSGRSQRGGSVRPSMYLRGVRKIGTVGAVAALVASGSVIGTAAASAESATAVGTTQNVATQNVATQATGSAIESPAEWRARESVSGQVFFDRVGGRATFDSQDEPLAGVRVYAQWQDYPGVNDGAGAVSPVYTTTTDAEGKYSISLPVWTDVFGHEHGWEATAGQKLRVWADNPDPERFQTSFVENDGAFGGQGDRYMGTWTGLAVRTAVDYNISFQERQQAWLWGDDVRPAVTTRDNGGNVRGRVWFEERGTFGDVLATPFFNDRAYGETAAPGITVRASYVNDEVAKRFDAWKDANRGASREEFRQAQQQILADYRAETGESGIAETIETQTGVDGTYTLQFNGLWGESRTRCGYDDGVLIFSRVCRGVEGYEWGTVAPSPEAGTFLMAGTGEDSSKHINGDYMYVSPVMAPGIGGSMDTMQEAMFGYPADQSAYVTDAAAGRTDGAVINDLDFALRMEQSNFDVTPYDARENLARPGETAEVVATGYVPFRTYDIVWTDSEGTEVKRCTVTASGDGSLDAEACSLTVPEDLRDVEIYTASIYAQGNDLALAADSFAADPVVFLDPIPAYTETPLVEAGGSAISEVSFTGDPAPEGTTYSIAEGWTAPEGWTVEIDPATGTVTATAAEAGPNGADVETLEVPVVITYPNGFDGEDDTATAVFLLDTDGDGEADVTDADDDGDGVSDEDEIAAGTDPKDPNSTPEVAPEITDYQPGYEQVIVGGGETVVSPVDYTGDPAPEGTVYEIEDGWTAPEGWTVEIDPVTGEITVTTNEPGPNGADVEEISVPVVITYPDGAEQDVVSADFQLDTDGDGNPDVTDADDDGDGVSDEDEIAAGTDPKDPNSTPEEPAEPETPVVTDYQPAYLDVPVVPAGGSASSAVSYLTEDVPAGATFEIDPSYQPPSGWSVSIDPATGLVTATVVEAGPNGADVERISVPVIVTYPDGAVADVITADFLLDTDGDGTPDVTDEDDDNDGYTDVEEQEAGTDPKDPNSVPEVIEEPTDPVTPEQPSDPETPVVTDAEENTPGYEDATTEPGQPVVIDQTGDQDMPEGTEYDIDPTDVPEGWDVEIDRETGEITVTPPADATEGDQITVEVEVTYPDGSTETVEVTVEVTEPEEEGTKPTAPEGEEPGDDQTGGKDDQTGDEEQTKPVAPTQPLAPVQPVRTVTNAGGSVTVHYQAQRPQAQRAAAAQTGRGTLARTGADPIVGLLVGAMGAIALGGVLVLRSKRRGA